MQIDSKPDEMDKLDRRIIQLKLEEQALAKETDEASLKRLEIIEVEREKAELRYKELETIWLSEKDAMQGAQGIKTQLEQAKIDLEIARRAGDLNRMSELQYGRIPELELQLEKANSAEDFTAQLIKKY